MGRAQHLDEPAENIRARRRTLLHLAVKRAKFKVFYSADWTIISIRGGITACRREAGPERTTSYRVNFDETYLGLPNKAWLVTYLV